MAGTTSISLTTQQRLDLEVRDGRATSGTLTQWDGTMKEGRRLTPQELQGINTDLEDGRIDSSAMRELIGQHADPDLARSQEFDGRYRDIPDGTTNEQFTVGDRGENVTNWQEQMRRLYQRTGDEGYNLDPRGEFENEGVDGMFGPESARVREHWRSQNSPPVVSVEVEQEQGTELTPPETEQPSSEQLSDDQVIQHARDLRQSDRGEGPQSQLINGISDYFGLNWNMGARESTMLGIIEGLDADGRQRVHERLMRDYPDLYPNGLRTLVNNNSQPGPEQTHLLSLLDDVG